MPPNLSELPDPPTCEEVWPEGRHRDAAAVRLIWY